MRGIEEGLFQHRQILHNTSTFTSEYLLDFLNVVQKIVGCYNPVVLQSFLVELEGSLIALLSKVFAVGSLLLYLCFDCLHTVFALDYLCLFFLIHLIKLGLL